MYTVKESTAGQHEEPFHASDQDPVTLPPFLEGEQFPVKSRTRSISRGAIPQKGKHGVRLRWLIIGMACIVIIVSIIGALLFVTSPDASRGNDSIVNGTQTLTTRSHIASIISTPTNTPILGSKRAQTTTPSPTPMPTQSPTHMATPTPSSTLIVTPASFHAQSDCQKSGRYYICTSTLQLPKDYQGDLKWVASSGNLDTFINPSEGTLAPGDQQQVIIYVLNSCPHTGTINFSTKDESFTIQWSC